ncbi:MAG: undecaprenyl-phosphate glucose phosphotransferase [Bacteroidia bacterium]
MNGFIMDGRLKQVLLFSDLLLLNISFFLSYFLRFGSFTEILSAAPALFLLQINVYWLLLGAIFTPHAPPPNIRITKIMVNYLIVIAIHFLLIAAFFAFQKWSYVPRLNILFTYLIFIPIIFTWLILKVYSQRKIVMSGQNIKNVVIVGYSDVAESLNSYFQNFPFYGFNFLGFFDDRNAAVPSVRGNIAQLPAYCLRNNVHAIYICLPNIAYDKVKEIVDFGEENFIKVNLVPDFRGFSVKGLKLQRYSHIPVLSVSAIPLDDNFNCVMKRAFDLGFSLMFLLLVFSWLYPLIALLIKLDSPGPAFFRQTRAGKDNKPFVCYKFRTMKVDDKDGWQQATRNDDRITRFGTFLRRTSLDEIPQFINVLQGDMSVIGPRPHPYQLNDEYYGEIHRFMVRHSIKPGITGLAQAKGYRGETNTPHCMRNRVRLDLFYLSNWTFNFDLKIIWLTLASLVRSNGKVY